MSEMIERIATVLEPSAFGAALGGQTCPCSDCQKINDNFKATARTKARSIIAAMREPTEAMIKTGGHHYETKTTWMVMIDEALK